MTTVWNAVIEAAWAFLFAFADAEFWRDTITAVLAFVLLAAWVQQRWQRGRDEWNAEQAVAEAEKAQQRELYREAHQWSLDLQIAKGMLERAALPETPLQMVATLRADADERLTKVAITAVRILVEHELAYGFSTEVLRRCAAVASLIASSGPGQLRSSEDLTPAVEDARRVVTELRSLMRQPVRLAEKRT